MSCRARIGRGKEFRHSFAVVGMSHGVDGDSVLGQLIDAVSGDSLARRAVVNEVSCWMEPEFPVHGAIRNRSPVKVRIAQLAFEQTTIRDVVAFDEDGFDDSFGAAQGFTVEIHGDSFGKR